MGQVLAKVTGALDAARGPDVELRIVVARDWFGQRVAVRVPRCLHCAVCSGGGCDRCGRAGALRMVEQGQEFRQVELALPELGNGEEVCVRFVGEGALDASSSELGRGHLLLRVRPGACSDEGVVLCARAAMDPARVALMRRSLIMATALIIVFFGMLKLSGWL